MTTPRETLTKHFLPITDENGYFNINNHQFQFNYNKNDLINKLIDADYTHVYIYDENSLRITVALDITVKESELIESINDPITKTFYGFVLQTLRNDKIDKFLDK